jgi:cytochrome P450
MAWGLKLLSDNPEVQKKVLDAMVQSFPAAAVEGRWPTAQEIVESHIPYLDATQEEIIRKSLTAPGVFRTATVDTILLGRPIPKGTSVLMLSNGPDLVAPPVGLIPETLRSESSRTAKGRTGSWDPADLHVFKPERWLTWENGKMTFDSTAGPLLTFGLGPRGCFGRRMAYLELKISLVLLLWNFKLKSLPKELNTWGAVDRLTHQPKQCYLRLEKI